MENSNNGNVVSDGLSIFMKFQILIKFSKFRKSAYSEARSLRSCKLPTWNYPHYSWYFRRSFHRFSEYKILDVQWKKAGKKKRKKKNIKTKKPEATFERFSAKEVALTCYQNLWKQIGESAIFRVTFQTYNTQVY